MTRGYHAREMSVNAANEYANGNKPISKFTKCDAQVLNKFLNNFGCRSVTVAELKHLLLLHGEVAKHHVSASYRLVSFYSVEKLISYFSNFTSSLEELSLLEGYIEGQLNKIKPQNKGESKLVYILYNYDYKVKNNPDIIRNSGCLRGIMKGNVIYELNTTAKRRTTVSDTVHITKEWNEQPSNWNSAECKIVKKYF